MQALYLDDSVHTCDCCGKDKLKATVAMKLNCGGIVHYGTTCASRNSGKDQKKIKTEIYEEAARQQNKAAKMAANAQALAAWQQDDHGHHGLNVQLRNYHSLGGAIVNGNFSDWLEKRALGLS